MCLIKLWTVARNAKCRWLQLSYHLRVVFFPQVRRNVRGLVKRARDPALLPEKRLSQPSSNRHFTNESRRMSVPLTDIVPFPTSIVSWLRKKKRKAKTRKKRWSSLSSMVPDLFRFTDAFRQIPERHFSHPPSRHQLLRKQHTSTHKRLCSDQLTCRNAHDLKMDSFVEGWPQLRCPSHYMSTMLNMSCTRVTRTYDF